MRIIAYYQILNHRGHRDHRELRELFRIVLYYLIPLYQEGCGFSRGVFFRKS